MEPLQIQQKKVEHYQEFLNKSKPTDEFLDEYITHVNLIDQKFGETFSCLIDQTLHLINEYRQCKQCDGILCQKRCHGQNDCPKCRQKLELRGLDLNLKYLLEYLAVDGCNFKDCEESIDKRDKNKKYLIYSQLIKHWNETCQYCDVVCSLGCLEKFNRINARQHYKQCIKAIEYLKYIQTCNECGNKLRKINDYICQICKEKMQNANRSISSSISNLAQCPVCKGKLLLAFKYKCQTCKIKNQISLGKDLKITTQEIESPPKNEIRQNRLQTMMIIPNAQRARTESRQLLNFDQHNKLSSDIKSPPSKAKCDFNSKRNSGLTKKKLIKFGIENKKGHLSCFLNSCLQALWNLAPIQRDMRTFCQQIELDFNQENNNQLLKLTHSIKDLYLRIFNSEGNIQFGNKLLSSSNIRKELFNAFYLTNQFNLNQKADANEALDTILQVIHSTYTHNNGINASGKYDFNQKCNDCFVHQSFKLNIDTQKKCACGKQFPQQTHENNFQYIVNIEDLLAIINEHLGPDMKVQSIESPLKKIMNQNCNIKHTTMKISIQNPLPNVICLNFNYHNQEFDPLSLLKIFLSISDTFKISDLFDTQETEIPGKDNGKWLLFDDTRVKEIIDWASLVNYCVQASIKPTILFFQRVPDIMKSKLELQANDKFNPTKLEMLIYDLFTLEKKARQKSEAMQEIEMMRYYQLEQQQFQSHVREPNSSFKPEPVNRARSEESNLDISANDAQIKSDIKKCMQYLKEEYLEIGVFLFKCENCRQYMHLNQLLCPYRGCKVKNSFYEDSKVVDKDTNYQIMQSIFEVYANEDKRNEILAKIDLKNESQKKVRAPQEQNQSPKQADKYIEEERITLIGEVILSQERENQQKDESPKILNKEERKQQFVSQPQQDYSNNHNFENVIQKQSALKANFLESQNKQQQQQQQYNNLPQRNNQVPQDEAAIEIENVENQQNKESNEDDNFLDDDECVITADVRDSVQINMLEFYRSNNLKEKKNQNLEEQNKQRDISFQNNEEIKEEPDKKDIQKLNKLEEILIKQNQEVLEQQIMHQGDKEQPIIIEKEENKQEYIAKQQMIYKDENQNVQENMESSKDQKNLNANIDFGMKIRQPENSQLVIPRGGEEREDKKKLTQVRKIEEIKDEEKKEEVFDQMKLFSYGLQDLETEDMGRRNYLTSIASQCHDSDPKLIFQQIICEISKGINPVPYFYLLDNILLHVQGKYLDLIKPQIVEIVQNFYNRNNKDDDNEIFYLIKGWQNILDYDQMFELFRIYNRNYQKYLDKKEWDKKQPDSLPDTLTFFEPQFLPLTVFQEDKYIIGEAINRDEFKQKYIKRLEEKCEEVEMTKTEKQRLLGKQFLEEQQKKKENIPQPESINNQIQDKQFEFKKQPLLPDQECYQEESIPSREEQKEYRSIVMHSKKEHFNDEQNLVDNKNGYEQKSGSIPKWRCPYCRHINQGRQLCFGKLNGEPCQFHVFQYDGAVVFLEEEEQIEDKYIKNLKYEQESKRILDNQKQPESDEHIGKNTQYLEYGITSNKEKLNKGAFQQPIHSAVTRQVYENSKQKVIRSNSVKQQQYSTPKNKKESFKAMDCKPAEVNGNLWYCEICGHTNIIDLKDLASCICSNCGFKNKIIYEMICIAIKQNRGILDTALRLIFFHNNKFDCLQCQQWSFDIQERRCKNCNFALDSNKGDNKFAGFQFCKILNQDDNIAVSKQFNTFGVPFLASDDQNMNQFNNISNQRQINNQNNTDQSLRSAIHEKAQNREISFLSQTMDMKVAMHELNDQSYSQRSNIHQELVVQCANAFSDSFLKKTDIRCQKCGFDCKISEDHQCRAQTGSQQQRSKSKSSNTKVQLKCRTCSKLLKPENFNSVTQGYYCPQCRIITKFII